MQSLEIKNFNLEPLSESELRDFNGGVAPALVAAATLGAGLLGVGAGIAIVYGCYCLFGNN